MNFLRKLTFIPLYLLSSLLSTLVNKYIIVNLQFHPSFLLLLIQSIIVVVFLLFLRAFNLCTFTFRTRCMFYWIPSAIALVVMIFSGLRALSHLSISMFTLFKNYTVIMTAILELVLFGRNISALSAFCFFMMVVSGMLIDYSEAVVDSAGYLWISVNVIASAVYIIVLRMTIIHHFEKEKPYYECEWIDNNDQTRKYLYNKNYRGSRNQNILRGKLGDLASNVTHTNHTEKTNVDNVDEKHDDNFCVIVFCNETTKKLRKNKIEKYIRTFEDMCSKNAFLNNNFRIIEDKSDVPPFDSKGNTLIIKKLDKEKKTQRPSDFESLMYSQILSIPFLFILSLVLDNYSSIPSLKLILKEDILSSPDYLDTFFLNMRKIASLTMIHNILIIKAFFTDLFDMESSAYFDDKLIFFVLLSGVSVFFVALSTVWCLRSLSSTTLGMMGATNKIIVSMSGIILGEKINTLKMMSILLGSFASILYVETIRKE